MSWLSFSTNTSHFTAVMPALVAGIHDLLLGYE